EINVSTGDFPRHKSVIQPTILVQHGNPLPGLPIKGREVADHNSFPQIFIIPNHTDGPVGPHSYIVHIRLVYATVTAQSYNSIGHYTISCGKPTNNHHTIIFPHISIGDTTVSTRLITRTIAKI